VLEFTARLHGAEVERRDLRQELQRTAQWADAGQQVHHLQRELEDIRSQVKLSSNVNLLDVC